MADSLIINVRHQLAWHQRLFCDASTAMMWGGWLWLWHPVLSSLKRVTYVGASFQPTLKLLASCSPVDLQGSVVALAGTSGTLLLWNLLPARKACAPEVHSLGDYARHFELPEQELQAGRETSVCVVHHDDDGRIIRIEARA